MSVSDQAGAAMTSKQPPTSIQSGVHYTCFIRLPFARGDFVDPPQVDWNSTKDRALWKIISKASSSKELDWEELSSRFEVSLSFLLQQAAWLYERHFAQMRAQMKKLSPSTSSSPLPPDSASNLTSASIANPATGLAPRAPSALSTRAKDAPTPIINTAQAQTSRPSVLSRTPSNRTVTQSRITLPPPSPRHPTKSSFRNSLNSSQKKVISPPIEAAEDDSPPPAAASDYESSDEGSQSMARSQAFRRPPTFNSRARGLDPDSDADEDDDGNSSGGFLPFAATATTTNDKRDNDTAATIRSPPPAKRNIPSAAQVFADSSASSASSSAAATAPTGAPNAPKSKGKAEAVYKKAMMGQQPADALSPRRRAELAKLSPRVRKDGSEGTPSMGSSFSDLDDASISQSALEDAFLSTMQHGAASRISNISQALKSKYL